MNSQRFFELDESADGEPPAKLTKSEELNLQPQDNGDSSASDDDGDDDDDIKLEEEKKKGEEESLWSIDDDTLFYPRGLINHGSGGGVRSVFVVWSEDYLLNFVFKKSARTQRTKMTKTRLSLFDAVAGDDDEQICDVLILEFNTLALMQSGRVYYFSSVRAAHPVPWLSGVRCISETRNGFGVIRLLDDAALCLEIYRDVVQLGKSDSTLLQRFDITYDERNLFNCGWRNERFTLYSQLVQEEHLEFLELVCGVEFTLSETEELHFFTVSGSVFVLIPAKPDAADETSSSEPNNSIHTTPAFQIQLLSTYATNVQFMKILLPQRICLIFLECGSIDIWFRSHLSNALRRKTHHTGSEGFTDHTFDLAKGHFYYTDMSEVTQLKFHYDTSTNWCTVHVKQTHKPVAGIIVLTWVEHIQQLVALSWNNIFCQMVFEPSADDDDNHEIDFENIAKLSELTPRKLYQLQLKSTATEDLIQLPKKLHTDIELQYQKQQLLAMCRKSHVYLFLCEASVEYTLQLHSKHLETSEDAVILYTQSSLVLHSNTLFSVINLNISEDVTLHVALWNVIIFNISSGKMHIITIPQEILHHTLRIILPAEWQPQGLLPVYHLKLLTFVAFEKDFLAVQLPVDLKATSDSFHGVFNPATFASEGCLGASTVFELDHLFGDCNAQQNLPPTPPPAITHILKFKHICKFSDILELFTTDPRLYNRETDVFELNFMSAKLQLNFIKAPEEQKKPTILKMTSRDAAALYYANVVICSNIVTLVRIRSPEILMYQCEIERLYGTLTSQYINEPATPASISLHLENLKHIYHKIRNELGLIPRS